MSECSFLGFTMAGKKIRWTDKALAIFKQRVKEMTGRSWGVSMDHRLHKLAQYLRGWTAYFGIRQYYRPVPELDDWIRRRIRMCYWKQWRWVRTKIKHLLALGRGPRLQVRLRGLGRSEEAELCDAAARKAEPEDGDPAWRQQQELLAHGENSGGAAGVVQRVVESAGTGQRERAVVKSPGLYELKDKKNFVERADLLNRPLRTRTVGGVGAGG